MGKVHKASVHSLRAKAKFTVCRRSCRKTSSQYRRDYIRKKKTVFKFNDI